MRWFVVLIVIVFCADSYAQDCSNVIALSKTIRTSVSDKREVEAHAANFCSEYSRHFMERSTYNFGASFSFLSGSAEGGSAAADEVASKYCSASDRSRASSDAFRQYIESIAPGAYTAYEQCLVLTNADVRFNVNVGSVLPKEFSLTASFRSSTGDPSTTIAYTSSADVTCKWDGLDGETKRITNGRSSILKCTRGNQETKSYVTVVWIGSGGPQNPLTLPWQAYDTAGVPVDSLTTLTRAVTRLGSRVDELTADLGRIRSESGSINMRAVGTRPLDDGSQCPTGPGGERGELSGRVSFSRPFASVPTVTIGLSTFDMAGDSNRIIIVVTGVDSGGFNYSFKTWCLTKVHSATATWMAVSR